MNNAGLDHRLDNYRNHEALTDVADGLRFAVYAIELRGVFFITVNRQLTTINTEIGAIWWKTREHSRPYHKKFRAVRM